MDQWIEWTKRIKAISQIGKTYAKDPYDLERYNQLEGLSHEMFASLADAPVGRVDHFFIPEVGYATPKVDFRGAIFRDDTVLLVRERSDNRWTLPGGWADVCESPSEGVVREVFEESGYRVARPRLAAIIDRNRHDYVPKRPDHIYKLFFVCDLEGGAPAPNLEISDVSFFSVNDLPELSIDRVLPADIDRLWAFHSGLVTGVYVD